MSNTHRRGIPRGVAARLVTTGAAAAVALGGLAIAPAVAGPGGVEGPGCFNDTMPGTVVFTSATEVAEGQRIFFAGQDFPAGTGGVYQALNAKLDAGAAGEGQYTGEAAVLDDGIIDTFQIQAGGLLSGSFVVPEDIDDPEVNPNADGPHYLRLLAPSPPTSCFSDDFVVDAAAEAAPEVTADAVTSSSRGGSSVTVTVTGTGFDAGEQVQVRRVTGADSAAALEWTQGSGGTATTVDQVAADASGNLSGRIVLPLGTLTAGEHQLLFPRAAHPETPAAAQVEVDPITSLSGLAQESDGSFSLSNVPGGTVIDTITLDQDGDAETTDDQSSILGAPLTVAADATTGTATVSVPASHPIGADQVAFVHQSVPYSRTYQATVKVSPSSSPLNEDLFERVETAEVAQGLYQTAYSETTGSVYATTAYQTEGAWDGTLYKLDPDTLAVEDSVRPGFVSGTSGARFATYGIGVDDENGHVWITNTRQNTVAVYDAETLDLVKQFESGIINHSRDVIVDEATNKAFVSAAARGSNDPSVIGVFDTETLEQLESIEVGENAADFTPMSLELDEEGGTLYTVSISTSEALAVDTATGEAEQIDLEADVSSASGVAYADGNLYIASQGSDNLLIADASTGETVADVPAGAGSLNVAISGDHVFVANFGGSTVSVHELDGTLVARLAHVRPNHVHEGPDGSVFSVNKDNSNTVVRFSPAEAEPEPEPEPELKVLVAGKPQLKGKLRIGGTIRVVAGKWTPGTKLTVRWLANGKVVKGATKASLKITKKLKGKRLVALVTGTKAGYETKSVRSKATKKVPAPKKGKKNKKRR